MLEKLTDSIFGPFRALRSRIFSIQQLPTSVKGEINRAKSEAGSLAGEARSYGNSAKEARTKAAGAQQRAGQVGAAVQAPKKRKMGLFSRKVACTGCGQKLHPSWDECPYCGAKQGAAASAPAAVAPGGGGSGGAGGGGSAPSGSAANRTMALDIGSAPGASGSMLGWFIPLEGNRAGELIELKGRITVGKSADNAVVFDDPSISGHHCEFVGSPAGFKLNDLGSTNGTFVNDKRVQSHDLIDNDNVTLGRVRFKYKSLS